MASRPAVRGVGAAGAGRARADRRPRPAGGQAGARLGAAAERRAHRSTSCCRWPTRPSASTARRCGPGRPGPASWPTSWLARSGRWTPPRPAACASSCGSRVPTRSVCAVRTLMAGRALDRIADHAVDHRCPAPVPAHRRPRPPRHRDPMTSTAGGPYVDRRSPWLTPTSASLPPAARRASSTTSCGWPRWSPRRSPGAPRCSSTATCTARRSSSRATTCSTPSPSTSRSAATRCSPCSSPWPATCGRSSPPSA